MMKRIYPSILTRIEIAQQINQLVTETEQIKQQLGSNNAQMDTSIEREAETIDINAEAVAT